MKNKCIAVIAKREHGFDIRRHQSRQIRVREVVVCIDKLHLSFHPEPMWDRRDQGFLTKSWITKALICYKRYYLLTYLTLHLKIIKSSLTFYNKAGYWQKDEKSDEFQSFSSREIRIFSKKLSLEDKKYRGLLSIFTHLQRVENKQKGQSTRIQT